MPIQFRSEKLEARSLTPDGSQTNLRPLEVRFDPLLGATSRIAEGVKLQTADSAALERFQTPDASCPFCADRVDRVTPRIDPKVSDEHRIRIGETVLFPNLVPYSQHAAVAIYTSRHWLSINGFSPALIADNLNASIRYIRAVYASDPRARYCAWNVNYLFPSGGSLPHPHAQVFLDPIPTTMMRFQFEAGERYWQQNGASYWEDLVTTEKERNERFLWDIGSTAWMTAFAPGFQRSARRSSRPRDLASNGRCRCRRRCRRHLASARLVPRPQIRQLQSKPLFRPPRGLAVVPGEPRHGDAYSHAPVLPERCDAPRALRWDAAVDRAPEELAAELRIRSWDKQAR